MSLSCLGGGRRRVLCPVAHEDDPVAEGLHEVGDGRREHGQEPQEHRPQALVAHVPGTGTCRAEGVLDVAEDGRVVELVRAQETAVVYPTAQEAGHVRFVDVLLFGVHEIPHVL